MLSFAWLAPARAAQTQTLRGFAPDAVAREMEYEQIVNDSPNAAAALRYERGLSSHVHRMGQPADYRTAVYMRDRLAADGWEAHIVTYVVPTAWPTEQSLEFVAPYHRMVDLYEPALPGDPWSADHAAIGKPYTAYAADGDASGPLVYVNEGTRADYATLARMHVSVRGAIVLARMGGDLSSTRKAALASRMGARALFIFPEPFVDVYLPKLKGKPYPAGPQRPLGAALRNDGLGLVVAAGDPTVDGVPLPGKKHKSFGLLTVPPIPWSNVTPLVAQQLLRSLDGPKAPRGWTTHIASNFRVAGKERVHFVLKSRRFFGPMWNVIARMRGAVAPEESVVVGSHRDAWTYGAIDPGSGSVALLQLADAFAKLRHAGWHPYRTVIIGSWDGEELNYFGSDGFVLQHEAELKRGCWGYVNTDEVATGPQFFPYASDDLAGLVHSLGDVATAPNGKTVNDYWMAQDKHQVVQAPGTGSDHEPFLYYENIPSIGYIYAGAFGTWHSAYDNLASLKVFDPGMRYANAAARVTNLTVLRLADAQLPDVNVADLALGLQRRLNAFANARGDEARRIAVTRTLQPYVVDLVAKTSAADAQAQSALAAGDLATVRAFTAKARNFRNAFFAPQGITGDSWHRTLLYNSDDNISELPTLDFTLAPKTGDAELRLLVRALQRAQTAF